MAFTLANIRGHSRLPFPIERQGGVPAVSPHDVQVVLPGPCHSPAQMPLGSYFTQKYGVQSCCAPRRLTHSAARLPS